MDKQMNLNESVNTAIEKMENAKCAYEWLKRNENTSDTREQTRQFDIFKEINTVPDILLRCFVLEKGINCYEPFYDENRNFAPYQIDVQDLATKTYAHKVCSSILYHNSIHPENAYLEDVDFASFFDDTKEFRNLNTHVGVRGVLQDVYRIFVNLNKILLALDCNTERKIVSLSEEPGQFDFPMFYASMDNMNADERKFIMITDSLHDVEKEELASFLSIPWSMIIDYDGTTYYGGMESVMREYDIPYNKYQENQFTTNNSISYFPGRIMYVSLCDDDDDFRKQFRARGKKALAGERNWITTAVNKVRNTRTRGTIVVVGAQSNRTRDIIGFVGEEFKEIDVIYLSRQNGEVVEKTDDEDWGDTGNISNVIHFESSVFEALRRIHANKGSLPVREESSISTSDAIYCVHVPGVGKIGINDREQVQKLEQYFEFVHLDIGKDVTKVNEWNFFHGDVANWATIRYGNLPILSEKVHGFINLIRNNGYNKCYYIYHSPGIGGSTLGKQVCWELSREMPVLVAKEYCSGQMFKGWLHDLYIHLFVKNPFLILVDENLFSDSEMQDIEMAISNSDYRVNALFVKRISEVDARQRYMNPKERELLFTRLEPEKKEQLKARCFELLKRNDQESKYESRVAALEKTIDEKERFALLINLYLLEENFNLETYVGRFLKLIPDDIDGKRMTDLLVFTSMGAYFSNNVRIPISYYSEYLSLGQKRDYINDNTKKSSVEKLFKVYEEGLLLKVTEQGNKWYGIKHYLIAQEMLKQLIGGEHWESFLPEYSRQLTELFISLSKGHNEIDGVILNIVTALFTDKTRDREPRVSGEFTALLDAMDDPAKIDIILYLADSFEKIIKENIPAGEGRAEYKLLAHIYAQCARVRSKCLLTTENMIDETEIDIWINKTVSLIYDEGIFEYDLEDMLGRCYLERIKRISHDDINDENIDNILKNIDNAILHFSNTIWYGSASYGVPGKLETIWRGIEIIKIWKGWGEENLIERLHENEKTKSYLEMGNELIREVDEYEMTTQGRVRMLQEKEQFEKSCSPLEPSMLIQNLENLRLKVDPQDYSSQYVISSGMVNGYERKYYTQSSEYRRSQLIYRALKGDKDAQDDAERVFKHLDLLVKLGNTHEVSYTTYKCWFEYAKYLDVPLVRAWDVAIHWKNQELSRVRDNSLYESNLLRPYYYLFVIALLRYLSNQGMTEKDVSDRKADLNKQIKATSRNTSVVQDWFATGKGMGQLYDRSWINLADVDSEAQIRVVSGKVVHYENNWGYMKLSNPRAMGSWGRTPIGQRYSKDCDVFFDGRQSGVISKLDVGNGQEKEFKVGFSYERMVASTKSLERNIKKSYLVDEIKSSYQPGGIRPVVETSTITGHACAKFFPKYYCSVNPSIGFLNGVLENGQKAELSLNDIAKFSDQVQKYGSPEIIIHMLENMESFDVCIMEERVGSDGVKVAIVSLYDTDINLGQILQSLSVEKRFSSRHNIDLNLISFSPDDLVQSYPYKYLNGSLANGMRGGLSSFDIERFGEELDEYGNSGDVLQLLYKIPSFDVVIEDSRKPRKCRLSLYATGKTLTEILDGTEKDANETVAEKLALTTEKKAVEEYPQKAELPDATGKSVVLFDCDFSRAKSISGMVLLDGYSDPFPALIPSVQTKIMKDLKKKKRIKATIISKNENQYILKLKQS